MTAAEILRELVAIASPSKVSNLLVLQWVKALLGRCGWTVELLSYTDEAGVGKANLIAWPGSCVQPERFDLAFVCHTDTVPFAAGWMDALVLEERDGNLHGCGSCDVKGALACFLAAVELGSLNPTSPVMKPTGDMGHLAEVFSDGDAAHPSRKNNDQARMGEPGSESWPHPPSQSRHGGHPDFSGFGLFASVGLILTADEEIGCRGMERLLACISLKIGSAIVSEPTSLRAGIAGKGYGLARVTVEGREAHSAFPAKGVSAISVAARLIVQIEEAFTANAQVIAEDPLFDPPRTTLNIGVVEGGTAKNIVPGKCSFLVEWRAIPGDDPQRILADLRTVVAEAQVSTDAVIRLEELRAEKGFSPAGVGRLQRRLAELLPGDPMGISFGSEASRVARIADEVIVIGPGDMRTAHSDRECVPVPELERWTSVLRELISS
jgi:acetylornithine deacetylase/succinyl-diaminopimelate desuccinylase-like protein